MKTPDKATLKDRIFRFNQSTLFATLEAKYPIFSEYAIHNITKDDSGYKVAFRTKFDNRWEEVIVEFIDMAHSPEIGRSDKMSGTFSFDKEVILNLAKNNVVRMQSYIKQMNSEINSFSVKGAVDERMNLVLLD